MYAQQFNQDLFYQGDIFKGLSFIVLPDTEIVLPTNENIGTPTDSSNSFFSQTPSLCKVIKYVAMGMVLSQNCDIDHKPYIHISPIFPVSLRYSGQRDHLISLRKQKVKYEIHLPPIASLMEESFVDLQIINSIKREHIKKEDRIAVLSDYGRSVLAEHLRDFYGRVEIKPYVEIPQEGSI